MLPLSADRNPNYQPSQYAGKNGGKSGKGKGSKGNSLWTQSAWPQSGKGGKDSYKGKGEKRAHEQVNGAAEQAAAKEAKN